jgi:hypothetical protein
MGKANEYKCAEEEAKTKPHSHLFIQESSMRISSPHPTAYLLKQAYSIHQSILSAQLTPPSVNQPIDLKGMSL